MKTIYTYQDLLKIGDDEEGKRNFIISAISQYKTSDLYKWAYDADQYIKQLNTTIMSYRKVLYTMSGKAVPDNYSANYKTTSNYFKRFVTQAANYILANGVSFQNEETKERLGGADFDVKMYEGLCEGLVGAVSFLFWNVDHIETVFSAREFVPLWDERKGSLNAGLRFWQLSTEKPLMVTLYEMDGYTEYSQDDSGELQIIEEKRPYKYRNVVSDASGIESSVGENYPTFPIVPLWGNREKQSELVGLKTEIDAYDLIKSGFANDLSDVAQVYWIIKNAGGMDDVDMAKFMSDLKRLKATILEDGGAEAEAHTQEIPYQSREVYLTRLENDMYYDAMAMNPKDITAGNVTATAIRAAYDNLDQKAGEIKFCLMKAISAILELAGIKGEVPKFKPNRISNDTETTQNVLAAAEYLDTKTILQKLPFVFDDEVEEILGRLEQEEAERFESEVTDVEQAGQSAETNGQETQTDGKTPV